MRAGKRIILSLALALFAGASLQAAKAAGAHCVGITSSFPDEVLLEAGADETFAGFEDLILDRPEALNH